MLESIAKRLFGSANDRYVKDLHKYVDAINVMEPDIEALSDDELKARTGVFRGRLDAGETEDDLMVEAFAVVREAARR
ncbi:MAG: hypothetical protein HQ501_11135, partial [Rhodospirillales bacterium]|nr:hypothetical protein [Rhodospirillales bacterium]